MSRPPSLPTAQAERERCSGTYDYGEWDSGDIWHERRPCGQEKGHGGICREAGERRRKERRGSDRRAILRAPVRGVEPILFCPNCDCRACSSRGLHDLPITERENVQDNDVSRSSVRDNAGVEPGELELLDDLLNEVGASHDDGGKRNDRARAKVRAFIAAALRREQRGERIEGWVSYDGPDQMIFFSRDEPEETGVLAKRRAILLILHPNPESRE